jgi:hypothetical protein
MLNLAVGLAATILSALHFHGNIATKNVWGTHFNVGADTITVSGALVYIFMFINETKISNWNEKEITILLINILSFFLTVLGLLSAISSLYSLPSISFDIHFGEWYVGMVFWITGAFAFYR